MLETDVNGATIAESLETSVVIGEVTMVLRRAESNTLFGRGRLPAGQHRQR